MHLLLPLTATLALAVGAHAQAAQEIVRQRLPDGSVVFTDRPQPGGTIERRWAVEPEDPAQAQARRDALARDSAAVSERLNRRAAEQREAELQAELARTRAARDAAEREAARARAEATEREAARTIVWPALRPPPRPQPAPVGITPAPPRERAIDRLIPPRRTPTPAPIDLERDR